MKNKYQAIKELKAIINDYDECPLFNNNGGYCVFQSNEEDRFVRCDELVICPLGYKNKK